MASRLRYLPALLAALSAAVVAAPGGGARPLDTVEPTLYVNYAMNCTFTILDDNHNPVTQIAPGKYQVQITTPVVFADVDLSGNLANPTDMTACRSFVQFSLTGPGVSISTSLQEGDEDYGIYSDVGFQPGSTYTAVDNNQPSVARAVFTTTTSGTATNPTGPTNSAGNGKTSTSTDVVGSKTGTQSSSTPDPLRGTLAGAVSAAGKVTLALKGKAVSTLKAGRYTVVVSDASKTNGFVLQQAGKGATSICSNAFVGKKTATVDLKPGQWLFYPTIVGAKTYFLVIA
jgi:hypothetical protein